MLAAATLAASACDAPSQNAGQRSASGPAPRTAESGLETMPVTVAGEEFDAELAVTSDQIMKGMGGRDAIGPREAMLFVFPRPAYRAFVMRDCTVPIDIAYLDGSGEVVSVYTMEVEPPRREGESFMDYNRRLKQYPSRYRTTYVLEAAGGTWEKIGLESGQTVHMDLARLKTLAR